MASAAGPQNLPVMAITMPRPKAEIVVPFRLPSPPTITTAKLMRRMWKPLLGCTVVMGA